MKLYLIIMYGQGDVDIRLVRQDGWDALDDGVFTPEMINDYIIAYGEPDLDMKRHILGLAEMEGGSPVNDVALNLPPVIINGKPAHFRSVTDLISFLQAHPEIKIEEEWEGYIY
jgi:hypothetical protein